MLSSFTRPGHVPRGRAWLRSERWCRGTYAPEPRGAAAARVSRQAAAPRTWRYREGNAWKQKEEGEGREERGQFQGRTGRLESQAHGCISILPAISYSQKAPPLMELLLVGEVGCGSSSSLQMFLLPWQEYPNTSSKGELSCSGG